MSAGRFVSLFSGVGGMDLGLERSGWECVAQVEKDEYRQRVLARHWPAVRRWGAITALDPRDLPGCDLIAGGFPCTDVSTANAERTGLSGARSGLFWELARVVRAVRPRWLLIENVPGLFSSPGGERAGQDFGTVLNALDDLGYFVEWRTVDSRYYGVPQRRRRVFLAGHLGGPPAQPVLFEPEGSAGSAAPGAAPWENAAVPLTPGVGGGSCHPAGRRQEDDYNLVASTLGGKTPRRGGYRVDLDRSGGFVASLGTGSGGPDDNDARNGGLIAHRSLGAEATADLSAKGNRIDGDSDSFVVAFGYDSAQMTSGANRVTVRPGTALPLNGSGRESVAYALGSHGFTTIDWNEAPPLRVGNGSPETATVSGEPGEWRVRRYTPQERELLQGMPPGWTCLCGCEPYSTMACKCPDGPRERATGDAVTVNVAEWLGRRVASVKRMAEMGSNCG